MRLVVQRVKKAEVKKVETGEIVGKIEKGLFVLIGIKKGDTEKLAISLAEKLLKLRVMSDANDKMNLSVRDTKDKVLVVSQFTLHGNTSGGNRPSFIDAEEPQKARNLYEIFIKRIKDGGIEVEKGSFGEHMETTTILDGPVTILYLD